jgi:hypothetical protein
MPVPGQEILRRIQEFASASGVVEQTARQAAETMAGEIDRLVTNQSESFRELAQLYLPRLGDDVERNGWSEVRSTLQSIMLRKEDARRVCSERLRLAAEQRIQQDARWQGLSDRLNELTSRCDAQAAQFATQLAEDVEFQALSKRAAEGQARLEQAEANLQQVDSDAKAKLPGYNQSRLFQYLWHSQFGTERYARRGLTRRLDRWVSHLIGYPQAAAGYRFLSTAPEQMRQLIEEQQKTVASVMKAVETRQTIAENALGLPVIQEEGRKVRAEYESAGTAAESARKAEEIARQQLTELDSPDCPYYRDALTAFQNLIERTERSLVAARAAQTPELTDDQVVARLKHIDEQVAQKKQQLDRFFSSAEQAAKRTARIHDLASKCRRAQFDHPRRVFDDDFDLQAQLDALLAGTLDADTAYQNMYRRQRLDSPVADKAAAVLQGPMSQVVLQTMAHAAGAALGSYAARAGQQHRVRGQNKDWF